MHSLAAPVELETITNESLCSSSISDDAPTSRRILSHGSQLEFVGFKNIDGYLNALNSINMSSTASYTRDELSQTVKVNNF